VSLTDRSPRGNIATPLISTNVDLSTLYFSNPRLPLAFNGDAQKALDYIFAALYPNWKSTVATPADLPLVGNSPNDYYIVSNDGDGKSAGYVWVVADNGGAWAKKYDVDWSYEGIYAETLNRANYVYVSKLGMTDKDNSGAEITGLYAGQTVYGGDKTLQNLTFNANSADSSGFVQTDNTFRPTSNNTLDLGTTAFKWKNIYAQSAVVVDTLSISSGTITDSSGTISFGSTILLTLGDITGNVVRGTSLVADNSTYLATIVPGSYTDTSGAVSFGSANLSTTGTLGAGVTTLTSSAETLVFNPNVGGGNASIISSLGVISFGTSDLSTGGAFSAGSISSSTVTGGNISISANTISAQNTNGSVALLANGTGVINLQSAATTLGIAATGNISATGFVSGGNLKLSSNTFSSISGDIVIAPFSEISFSSVVKPGLDATYDIGKSALRFKDIYLSGAISDGTTSVSQSVLQSLRGINIGVTTGMSLFWNGTQWTPSIPDTEITHNTLSGLTTGDAGHTQFVMLAGRSGGQTVQGGTSASESLVFESTSNATKGFVKTKDSFVPFTNASFSGTWAGTDLGASTNYFKDVFTKGQHFGFRFENVSALPANSAQNIGRSVFNTTAGKVYVDTGTAWVAAGSSVEKYSSDTTWDGVTTTQTIDVSASISDARTALWQFCDNSNNYERIYTKIEAISASQVRITVSPALSAGSYRLLGVN